MKKKKMLNTTLVLAFVIFSCCLVLIPLYFTVLNSFKPYSEIAANIAAFPKNPTLKNFAEAWKRLNYLKVLFNTLLDCTTQKYIYETLLRINLMWHECSIPVHHDYICENDWFSETG